ncbi:hypothetical protein TNCV_2655671 [Trichonephila clavipes]|nr:hypothetical protein TNCV_2655671 [Trichonephila clavipes]
MNLIIKLDNPDVFSRKPPDRPLVRQKCKFVRLRERGGGEREERLAPGISGCVSPLTNSRLEAEYWVEFPKSGMSRQIWKWDVGWDLKMGNR